MNLFNWLPSSKPDAWYGYDLLNTAAKERILTKDELKLFAHYKKMDDPQFKDKLPILLSKEKIVELWIRLIDGGLSLYVFMFFIGQRAKFKMKS